MITFHSLTGLFIFLIIGFQRFEVKLDLKISFLISNFFDLLMLLHDQILFKEHFWTVLGQLLNAAVDVDATSRLSEAGPTVFERNSGGVVIFGLATILRYLFIVENVHSIAGDPGALTLAVIRFQRALRFDGEALIHHWLFGAAHRLIAASGRREADDVIWVDNIVPVEGILTDIDKVLFAGRKVRDDFAFQWNRTTLVRDSVHYGRDKTYPSLLVHKDLLIL